MYPLHSVYEKKSLKNCVLSVGNVRCAHNGLKIALRSQRKESMKKIKIEILFSKTCQL